MKYIKQFFIIMLFSFIGEVLNRLIPFPVPAGVYGLILLFGALCLKIIKEEQLKDAADFLISIMPIFFVAPCVSFITQIEVLSTSIIPIAIISVVSTIAVIFVTGKIADFIILRRAKHDK